MGVELRKRGLVPNAKRYQTKGWGIPLGYNIAGLKKSSAGSHFTQNL
jgi:hypothetical protein